MDYQVIDIRPVRVFTRAELHDTICDAVKDTQSVLLRDLPNKLIMSKKQFYLLIPNLTEAADPEDTHGRLYFTPINCMEVTVDN